MLPYLAKIGTILIPAHAVSWLVAYVVGMIGFFHWARITGINLKLLLNWMLLCVIASLVGARLSAIVMLTNA